MTDRNDRPVPGADELRTRVGEARDALGRTAEEFAGEAGPGGRSREKAAELKDRAGERTTEAKDRVQEKAEEAKDRVQEKTAEVRDRAQEKAAELKDRTREKTAGAGDRAQEAAGEARTRIAGAARALGEKVQDRTPEPVREGTGRAVEAVRGRPGVFLAAGAAVLVAVLVARRRRGRC
ncbi:MULTISPECIES: hypothetical protein [unclassified Streptomyces]|uniref:hypothetical protein n=1 Tax=unclassified Streptomyces TaxID=2593676 RepID=UPI00080603EE|nr:MULTISPECIES: hypothetical protein [unclassified Streptomyces]MYR73690.1 hypothetical protein [Streptomyces sp. SID4925]SBV02761.1 Late embryogenesis abundant protein [Streptomyces sp. OspMP-M45]